MYKMCVYLWIPGSLKQISSPLFGDDALVFSNRDNGRYYASRGLSTIEDWGRLSDGSQVEIEINVDPDCKANAVEFSLKASAIDKSPNQTARVFINDEDVGNISLSLEENRPKKFVFLLPESPDYKYSFRFEIDSPIAPVSVDSNNDTGDLGIAFISMKLLSD